MPNASLHTDSNALEESTTIYGRLVARLRSTLPVLRTGCRAAGFWTAVGVPVLYIPLLTVGLDSTQDVRLFLLLLFVNLAALVVGRNHGRA